MLCRSILIVTLLLSLAACGPGDSSSSTSSSNASAANRNAADDASSNPSFTSETATSPIPVSDPVASAQASLDADSRQITPVLSYAPNADDSAHR
ncbi:hypothetical protein AWB83_06740 [Caballeronia ptereochthonis]|jgi:hypothetical protein|uniref:Lipoprotein n=1 Tax=Caballeronia ptereochthonis TaxID=1777144 RepID=A0A158E947_9BURK|nr:hypothetical protein AWB83_06740 [Caballeronia ptereochthonis]